ncbi:sugar ABC transporter permease [Kribbella sandramycini]|uniref:Multiple sugar transport system permease protein n=1 Tax=Kribbella sandramycini TaxID=60450 RepID=A0A7Y4L535_9ACTN|nr:sugar ABC transporter permease [Kribbella sandramycini]MBB6566789.1 multiple sugar transport system permease protein [Kribbella sandramycini]NOL44512.1 sugar ABC transporter permease [Kribbella sandramycini]
MTEVGVGRSSRARTPRPAPLRGRHGPRRRAWVGLVFVAPMLLLFLAFRFLPVVGALWLSLTDYRLSGRWKFIAFDNYTRLVTDSVFHQSLLVTLTYTLIFVPLTVLISLGTAMLLHQVVWRRGFFRGVFFLPYVTSIVLAAVIWRWIYDVEDGLLNAVLGLAGIGPVDFLGDSGSVLASIAVTSAWKGFGYSMLILLAGLQAVPASYLEAAQIDGASAWQRFRYITLPQLRPVLFFVLVIETIGSFQVFDAMYVMTGGGPVRSSYSLVYFLYDSGFKYFDFGYASAIGIALFLIVLVISLIQRRLVGRDD